MHDSPLPNYRFARAVPADLPALVDLLGQLFTLEPDFHPDPDKQHRALQLLLARPDDAMIAVARHAEDGVVGMCSAQLVVSTASGAPSAWVEDVIVAQAHRGRGVGRRLLAELERWATEKNARRLQLLADIDNTPAQAFYRRLGWQSTHLSAWQRFLPDAGIS